MTPPPALPHDQVWTRLGVSRIHGIGVLAIRPIPAGTNVFAGDQREIVWIDATIPDSLAPAHARLYHDFCIRRGGMLGCPASFDLLGVGWHVNEPAAGEPANLRVLDDYQMIAARDIAEGEELTVRYDTFSGDVGRAPF